MSVISKAAIYDALLEVVDPELGVDVVNLGLIYDLDVSDGGEAAVRMTLTSIGCPFAPQLEQHVLDAVESVDGVRQARVDWSFEPPWTPENITEEGRDQLLALGYL
jgi:metal-sulfur cluster biosynthetic enzyme